MPPAKQQDSPKLFFLHLLSIVTLYATAISFIGVMFQVINLYIADPLQYIYGDASFAKEQLRSSLSFLIIMFPSYVGTLAYLQKVYQKDKKARDMKVRRWLVGLTLFIAGLTILFSVVSLVNHLLDGEMTLSFGLKFITIVVVAKAIVAYYWFEQKQYEK